jgi:hypothetical protein
VLKLKTSPFIALALDTRHCDEHIAVEAQRLAGPRRGHGYSGAPAPSR